MNVLREPLVDAFRVPAVAEMFGLLRSYKVARLPLLYGGMAHAQRCGSDPRRVSDIDLLTDVQVWKTFPAAFRRKFRQLGSQRRLFWHRKREGWDFRAPDRLRAVMESREPIFGFKVGVTLSSYPVTPEMLLADTDMAMFQCVDDGEACYTTPEFWQDVTERTMTVRVFRGPRELERTMDRIIRFENDPRYEGWRMRFLDPLLMGGIDWC